jgi:hypothetical protein
MLCDAFITILGKYQQALEAAELIKATLPYELLKMPEFGMYMESFYSVDIHVHLRFGNWEKVLSIPMPEDPEVEI